MSAWPPNYVLFLHIYIGTPPNVYSFCFDLYLPCFMHMFGYKKKSNKRQGTSLFKNNSKWKLSKITKPNNKKTTSQNVEENVWFSLNRCFLVFIVVCCFEIEKQKHCVFECFLKVYGWRRLSKNQKHKCFWCLMICYE